MVFALVVTFFAGITVGAVVIGLLKNSDDGDDYQGEYGYKGTCADCIYFNKTKHVCMNSYGTNDKWDLYEHKDPSDSCIEGVRIQVC